MVIESNRIGELTLPPVWEHPLWQPPMEQSSKASYTRGNGNYVTIKHNNIYQTQYLHMKKHNVRRGQYVKQGDVIGWVGMTGFTGGHTSAIVFGNTETGGPLPTKAPSRQTYFKDLKTQFFAEIEPIKNELECIPFEPDFLNDNKRLSRYETTHP